MNIEQYSEKQKYQISRIEKIFNDTEPQLEIINNTAKHQKCGNLLKLEFVYGIGSDLNINMIYGSARCDHCNEWSGYENDLISAIEVINKADSDATLEQNRLSILEVKDTSGYEYYFDSDSIEDAMKHAERYREHIDSDLYICQNDEDIAVKKQDQDWLILTDSK